MIFTEAKKCLNVLLCVFIEQSNGLYCFLQEGM